MPNLTATNAPGLYAVAAAGGFHGFTVAENGVYKVSWAFIFTGATVGDILTGYYTNDIGVRSDWMFGNNTCVFQPSSGADSELLNRGLRFSELMFVGGSFGIETLPSGPEIPTVQNLTGNAFSLERVSVLVERLSSSYST